MADTFTTNLLMTKMEFGTHDNTWGTVTSDNLDLVDAKLGNKTSIASTGGTTTLSNTEERVGIIVVTGTLVANHIVAFTGRGGFWIIQNNHPADATYGLTCKVTGQTGVTIPPNTTALIWCNGTDIQSPLLTGPQVGDIKAWPASVIPSGWLACYGQLVSRTTYAALFAVIGTAFGAGNGSTTFQLPDLRGMVIAGADNMGGVAAGNLTGAVLATVGGSQTHAMSSVEIATHLHAVDPAATASGADSVGHTHAVDPSNTTSTAMSANGTHTHTTDPTGVTSASESATHTHAADPAITTSGAASASMSHAHAVNPVITASSTDSTTHFHGTSAITALHEVQTHYHNLSFGWNANAQTGGSGTKVLDIDGQTGGGGTAATAQTATGSGTHTHLLSGSTDAGGGDHLHTTDIGNTTSTIVDLAHTHDTNIASFNTGTDSAGHTHTVDVAITTSSSTSTAHTHDTDIGSFTSGGESVTHTHTTDIASFFTGTAGSSTPFSIVQPTTAMNIIVYTGV